MGTSTVVTGECLGIGSCDCCPSMRFLCSGDHTVVSGPEGRTVRIEYETQFAREEPAMRVVRPDVHQTGGEFAGEECLDPLT